MKQYPYKFRFINDRIEWGQSEKILGTNKYFYYFGISRLNIEDRENLESLNIKPISKYTCWYDGPHVQLNLYYICFYWSTPWTKPPEGF